MKKLMAMAAVCMAGIVFAQEPEVAPAPEAAPAEPPKCECVAGKPCECPKPCECGGENKGPRHGEFRKDGRMGHRPEMRGPHGRKGPGMHRQGPKFKKCDCCPECKGVIILPPNATEGEPLFKAFGGERRGPRPEMKRPEMTLPEMKRPECDGQKPECGCAKPE